MVDARLQHPFTLLISGPTGCGKTEWISRFLERCDSLMTHTPHRLIFCFSEWQPLYQRLGERMKKKNINTVFVKGAENLDTVIDEYDIEHPQILVFDDLMGESEAFILPWFTKKSHHRNVSVIHVMQNLFNQCKEQRNISLNAHYMVIFRNIRDMAQIAYLGRQIFPQKQKMLTQCYEDATSVHYRPLFLDLKAPNNVLRLRTNILEENGHPFTEVYTFPLNRECQERKREKVII